MTLSRQLSCVLALLTPLSVWAHPEGAHAATFLGGLTHPLTGLDHLLAMFAVGLIAARDRDAKRWFAPLSFMASLTLGALVGTVATASVVEPAIISSVATLGFIALARRTLPTAFTSLLCATIGLCHGIAHGAEAHGALGFAFIGGMLLITFALHAGGIIFVQAVTHRWGPKYARWSGAPIAASGLALMFAAF